MNQTNRRQKSSVQLIIVLFLILLLFSVSAAAFHHHEDGFFHGDCPLCIAGNHPYMSNQNYYCSNIAEAATDIDLLWESLFHGSVYVIRISPRAPPA